MLSIYDRMVNRIKRQFPAAHNVGKAYIRNGNIEVQFSPFTDCENRYTLVYYGNNKYEIIRDWNNGDISPRLTAGFLFCNFMQFPIDKIRSMRYNSIYQRRLYTWLIFIKRSCLHVENY